MGRDRSRRSIPGSHSFSADDRSRLLRSRLPTRWRVVRGAQWATAETSERLGSRRHKKEFVDRRMKLCPCAFMNCRGDDDIDAKRSRPSIGKTREGPREERTRAFVWDPISGLHQGQQPKRLHSKAEYMAAPDRFAELYDFSLAPRAPSIHGTSRLFAATQ